MCVCVLDVLIMLLFLRIFYETGDILCFSFYLE